MAAYGLYTHIASNKFRSMLLLAGLFVLVYVMVYAAALIAEVMIDGGRSADSYLTVAARDLVKEFPHIMSWSPRYIASRPSASLAR